MVANIGFGNQMNKPFNYVDFGAKFFAGIIVLFFIYAVAWSVNNWFKTEAIRKEHAIRVKQLEKERFEILQKKTAKARQEMLELLEDRSILAAGETAHKLTSDFEFALDQQDPWGTPYHFTIHEKNEKVVTKYEIRSAGFDMQFDTQDDIVKVNSDLNFTNVGKSIGSKTGRTAVGFVKGLFKAADNK
jgi:hypothetical protein